MRDEMIPDDAFVVPMAEVRALRAALAREKAERAREADCGDPDDTLACDCRRHLVRAHHREKEARERAEAALRDLVTTIRIEIDARGGTKRQALARLELAEIRARAALAGSEGGDRG